MLVQKPKVAVRKSSIAQPCRHTANLHVAIFAPFSVSICQSLLCRLDVLRHHHRNHGRSLLQHPHRIGLRLFRLSWSGPFHRNPARNPPNEECGIGTPSPSYCPSGGGVEATRRRTERPATQFRCLTRPHSSEMGHETVMVSVFCVLLFDIKLPVSDHDHNCHLRNCPSSCRIDCTSTTDSP